MLNVYLTHRNQLFTQFIEVNHRDKTRLHSDKKNGQIQVIMNYSEYNLGKTSEITRSEDRWLHLH